jgi:hypothetical protein
MSRNLSTRMMGNCHAKAVGMTDLQLVCFQWEAGGITQAKRAISPELADLNQRWWFSATSFSAEGLEEGRTWDQRRGTASAPSGIHPRPRLPPRERKRECGPVPPGVSGQRRPSHKTLVIPTGAGAHATAEWRNPLFLPFSSSWNRDELSTSNFPFRKTDHQLTVS